MVPVRFFVASLVAAMALVIFMFVACELPLHAGKSRVQLHIVSDKSVSARDALQDAGIQLFRLSVTADGAEVFEKTFTETTFIQEFEAGLDRVFVLEALSGDGPDGQVVLRGETRADIIANQTIDLEITLVAVDSTTTAITGTLSNWVLAPGPRNNGGILTASGSVTAAVAFTIQASVPLTYGTFAIGDSGSWTYVLDSKKTAVKNLLATQTLTDTVEVSAGADTQEISITIYGAAATNFPTGEYAQQGGSGGGGSGAVGAYPGGDGGKGNGSSSSVSGDVGNDVIFGDGSGGGTGGDGLGNDDPSKVAGLGGGGNDAIAGGDGNDIIFGDGFDGLKSDAGGGIGGFGGGGGGGSGVSSGAPGGVGGIGAGSGSGHTGSFSPLVAGFGNAGGTGDTGGGNSAQAKNGSKGVGGSSYGVSAGSYGGGGGFGGANGGDGESGSQGSGYSGADGITTVLHVYTDTGGAIYSYVESVLSTVLSTYPTFGSGSDTINGGPGSDNLFGLGGSDIFVFELNDATTGNDIDTVWDFTDPGDRLKLTVEGIPITIALRDALIAAQKSSGNEGEDRRIVFRSASGKQVTIVLKNLGRDIVAPDFE